MSRKLMRLSIRFSPRTHALVKREAEMEGVTLTQFVREAALARAYLAIGIRGDADAQKELLAIARRTLHDEDGRRQPRSQEDAP